MGRFNEREHPRGGRPNNPGQFCRKQKPALPRIDLMAQQRASFVRAATETAMRCEAEEVLEHAWEARRGTDDGLSPTWLLITGNEMAKLDAPELSGPEAHDRLMKAVTRAISQRRPEMVLAVLDVWCSTIEDGQPDVDPKYDPDACQALHVQAWSGANGDTLAVQRVYRQDDTGRLQHIRDTWLDSTGGPWHVPALDPVSRALTAHNN
jgi:hypothetical protein